MTATIFDIERNSFADGPGIRTTVFFKGCNLQCIWCHNPESQQRTPQMMFYSDKCRGCGKCKEVCDNKDCTLCGKCALYCPADARKVCGKEYTADEVLAEIIKDKAYYQASGGGVTLSGGECLLQLDFVVELLKKCKQNGIHTAIDTAGHIPFECFEKVMPYTDLFLYDIKLFDSEKHKKYVGVDNKLILDNLKKLIKSNARVWVRIPIITGINDSVLEMQKIKEFLSGEKQVEKIELLPYHALGENKYRAIGRIPQEFLVPDSDKIEKIRKIFL